MIYRAQRPMHIHKLLQQIESLLGKLEKVLQKEPSSTVRSDRHTNKSGRLKVLNSKNLLVARDSLKSLGERDAVAATSYAANKLDNEVLIAIWHGLARDFFPDRVEQINAYEVSWSSRPQKRVLASCNIRKRRIIVAQELFEPAATRWLAPVLYHEMCHAVIGEGVNLSQSGRRMWHGHQFRQLEARHPDIPAMNAWISSGGWAMAVRSHRARKAWRHRMR
jgi:hypothetical protein